MTSSSVLVSHTLLLTGVDNGWESAAYPQITLCAADGEWTSNKALFFQY